MEEAAIGKVNADKNRLVDTYLKQNGNIINTDEARKLFSDVGYNGANSAAVHEASSAVTSAALEKLIQNAPKGIGYFFAGGSGAGKSTIARVLGDKLKDAAFVLDGNLSNYDSAIKKIKMAEDAGHEVTVPYVYRDPIEAWNQGVIKRLLTSATDKGRVVPLKEFMKNTVGALSTVKKLISDGIPTVGYENLKGNEYKELSIREIKSLNIRPDLQQTLLKATKELGSLRKITEDQYEALLNGLPHPKYKSL